MTERALPAIGVGVRPRPEAAAQPRPATRTHVGVDARPAVARKEAILTTPARAGMLVGASAAVYAVTLAGISGLQAEADAAVAAARAPYQDVARPDPRRQRRAGGPGPEGRRRGPRPGRHVRQGRHERRGLPGPPRLARGAGGGGPGQRGGPPRPHQAADGHDARRGRRELAVRRRLHHAAHDREDRRVRGLTPSPARPDVSTAPPEGDEPAGFVTFSARALGSALRLTVHLPDAASPAQRAAGQAAADAAWAEVLAEFDAVDVALSRFRDDSELTMLNRLAGSGRVVEVSWRTRRALAAIDRAGRVTDGRFDASILGALERIGEHGARLEPASGRRSGPGADRPRCAGRRTGSAGDRRSLVHVPPVPVDMGGIGKGLALRWACARALRSLPAGAGLQLEAGGDVVAGGTPPEDGWRIGVEDPAAADADAATPLVVVELRSGAVATSSVRVRHWVGPDGRAVHHLVDPRTGEPARDRADRRDRRRQRILPGPRSGARPCSSRDATGIAAEARSRDLAAWWITDEGRLGLTPAARVRTAWAAEDRLG